MKRTVQSIRSLALAFALVFAMFAPASAANLTEAETKASALQFLGLFKGVSATEVDFDLERAPVRAEALVMLIRAMGKEAEARGGTWTHPFTDVPSWAEQYIGYAYEKGLTNGVSATEFGGGSASAAMYLTFMLRALGYSEAAGDFTWDAPEALAGTVGILPGGVNTANFLRADVARISWAALEAGVKDAGRTLSQMLVDMNAFDSREYDAAKLFVEEGGGTAVITPAALRAAAEDERVAVIQVGSDLDLSGELFVDREDGPELLIYVRPGVTLTVSGEFTVVGCAVINGGGMVVEGTFNRGLGSFTNVGTATIRSGGLLGSGMSDTYNRGSIAVDQGGELPIDKGTQFHNRGTIVNNGVIMIDNGGSLFNDDGAIENNGSLTIASYFFGDLSAITGTGTVTDTRE